jgi:hypothetical protein
LPADPIHDACHEQVDQDGSNGAPIEDIRYMAIPGAMAAAAAAMSEQP